MLLYNADFLLFLLLSTEIHGYAVTIIFVTNFILDSHGFLQKVNIL